MSARIVVTLPRAARRNRYAVWHRASGGNAGGRHQRPAAVMNRACLWAAGALLATTLPLAALATLLVACDDHPSPIAPAIGSQGLAAAATTEATVGHLITFNAPGAGTSPGAAECFGGCPGTTAVNANAEGSVTGWYVDNSSIYHGFVRYADGTFKTFDAPHAGTGPNQGTQAYSINLAGAIAGEYLDATSIYHGFLRSPEGRITSFDIPGFKPSANQGPNGSANINSAGEIAGFYTDENNVYHGFVRYGDGKIETFNVPQASTLPNFAPQGTQVALESGLNNDGAITGWYNDANQAVHGYVRAPDGTITLFDDPVGGTGPFQGTYGGSINSEGAIAGGAIDGNYVDHGFFRDPDGRLKTFEAPHSGDVPGTFQGTFGVGINSAGTIAAYVTDPSDVSLGAVRDPDGNFISFEVKSAAALSAGQGTTPQGINAAGLVPGYYTDNNNVNHGFVWLPPGAALSLVGH